MRSSCPPRDALPSLRQSRFAPSPPLQQDGRRKGERNPPWFGVADGRAACLVRVECGSERRRYSSANSRSVGVSLSRWMSSAGLSPARMRASRSRARRRCGLARYRSASGAVSHVPAAQRRALHMLPPRIVIGGLDGTADACGVWRGALQYSMRIRHKGLRALHERDNPARVPAGLAPRLKRILFRLQEAAHPRRAGLPAASPEGRPRGPVERSRLRQLARGVPLRGRRGRGRRPDRLSLTQGEC